MLSEGCPSPSCPICPRMELARLWLSPTLPCSCILQLRVAGEFRIFSSAPWNRRRHSRAEGLCHLSFSMLSRKEKAQRVYFVLTFYFCFGWTPVSPFQLLPSSVQARSAKELLIPRLTPPPLPPLFLVCHPVPPSASWTAFHLLKGSQFLSDVHPFP